MKRMQYKIACIILNNTEVEKEPVKDSTCWLVWVVIVNFNPD